MRKATAPGDGALAKSSQLEAPPLLELLGPPPAPPLAPRGSSASTLLPQPTRDTTRPIEIIRLRTATTPPVCQKRAGARRSGPIGSAFGDAELGELRRERRLLGRIAQHRIVERQRHRELLVRLRRVDAGRVVGRLELLQVRAALPE